MNINLLKSVFKYSGIFLASYGTGLIIGNHDKIIKKFKKSIFRKDLKDRDYKNKEIVIPAFIKSDKYIIIESLIEFCNNLEPKVEVVRNVDSAKHINLDKNQISKARCFYNCDTLFAYKIEINKTEDIDEELRLLIHEISHAILHSGMAINKDPEDTSKKELNELEAELTTYLVLDVLGIKLTENDLSYLNEYFDKVSDAVLAFDKSRDRIHFAFKKISNGILKYGKRIYTSANKSKRVSKEKKRKFVDFERKFINGINKSRIIELKKIINLFKDEKYIELKESIKKFREKNFQNSLIEDFLKKLLIISNDLYSGPEPNDIFLFERFTLIDAFVVININTPTKSDKYKTYEYELEKYTEVEPEKEFHELDIYEFFVEYLQGSTWWKSKSIGEQWNRKIDTSHAKKLSIEKEVPTRIIDMYGNVYNIFNSKGEEEDICNYKMGKTDIPF